MLFKGFLDLFHTIQYHRPCSFGFACLSIVNRRNCQIMILSNSDSHQLSSRLFWNKASSNFSAYRMHVYQRKHLPENFHPSNLRRAVILILLYQVWFPKVRTVWLARKSVGQAWKEPDEQKSSQVALLFSTRRICRSKLKLQIWLDLGLSITFYSIEFVSLSQARHRKNPYLVGRQLPIQFLCLSVCQQIRKYPLWHILIIYRQRALIIFQEE